jgi:hypothetical protein
MHHVPERRSGAETAVSGLAAGGEEMDDADSSLARSAQPLHNSLAGADAGPGVGCVMNRKTFSKIAPIPKNQTWPFTQKS